MRLSKHAEQRWAERFPEHNLAGQYASARRVGKKTKQKIRARLAKATAGYQGVHYLIAPCGALFVCGPREFVITVCPPLEAPRND